MVCVYECHSSGWVSTTELHGYILWPRLGLEIHGRLKDPLAKGV